jgi:hypothetical protein
MDSSFPNSDLDADIVGVSECYQEINKISFFFILLLLPINLEIDCNDSKNSGENRFCLVINKLQKSKF